MGKKMISVTVMNAAYTRASGIPGILSLLLKAVRNVLVISPRVITNPRNIKPETARNMVHFLRVLRCFRVSCPISNLAGSCGFSINICSD
jgi:hypothetical protein